MQLILSPVNRKEDQIPVDAAWNHTFDPVLKKVGSAIKEILKLILLPKHPSWYGVAILVTAIILYQQAGGKVNLPFKFPRWPFL